MNLLVCLQDNLLLARAVYLYLCCLTTIVLYRRCIDYFQVCRNINQIKICMETGRKVILLNLENLYESLYDALNQVA